MADIASVLSGADRWHVETGDALEVARQLPDACVDLVAEDPPYCGVKDHDWDNQWPTEEAYLDWVDQHVAERRRILRPNGSLYWFASPDMAGRVECVIRRHLRVLNVITWRKPPFATKAEMNPKESQRAYFPASERVIFAEPDAPLWATLLATARLAAGLDRQEVSERVVGSRSGACWNWEAGIRFPERHHWARLRELFPDLPKYNAIERPFQASADVPYTDVWDFPTVNVYPGKHACEKPLALMRHIVAVSSRPDALVFDGFCGSGSTGAACIHEGRRFIGVERDSDWAGYARRRINRSEPFTALRDHAPITTGLFAETADA